MDGKHVSQAYAAMLCFASAWTPDPVRRQEYYRQWTARGASVDFAATFGEQCPEPRFHPLLLPQTPDAPPGPGRRITAMFGVVLVLVAREVAMRLLRRRARAVAPPPP